MYYTDGNRAKEDHAALNANPKTAGAKLQQINPITGDVVKTYP